MFVCETFLDDKVLSNYTRVRGYLAGLRKDRNTQVGGVAFCHKETVNVHIVEPHISVPKKLELLILKIIDSNRKDLRCVGCYHPPS